MDRILQSLGSTIHVLIGGATERSNLDLPAFGCDSSNRRKVTFGGYRKPCFNDID